MFKDEPIECEEDLQIMFDSIICTNESSFVSGMTIGDEPTEPTGKGEGAVAGGEAEASKMGQKVMILRTMLMTMMVMVAQAL